jgi:hypothetical protein
MWTLNRTQAEEAEEIKIREELKVIDAALKKMKKATVGGVHTVASHLSLACSKILCGSLFDCRSEDTSPSSVNVIHISSTSECYQHLNPSHHDVRWSPFH